MPQRTSDLDLRVGLVRLLGTLGDPSGMTVSPLSWERDTWDPSDNNHLVSVQTVTESEKSPTTDWSPWSFPTLSFLEHGPTPTVSPSWYVIFNGYRASNRRSRTDGPSSDPSPHVGPREVVTQTVGSCHSPNEYFTGLRN